MRHLKDIGFVIRRRNFADSDRFVTIFTKHHGKIEVLAKGVRKITSRRASHIELLNLVKFQTTKTRKNPILTDIEVISSFGKLKENYATIGMIFLVCELIDKLCPHNVTHEDVFNLIESTLKRLEDGHENVMPEFQTTLLTNLGFWDAKRKFATAEDVDQFVEMIIERKIKTKSVFKI